MERTEVHQDVNMIQFLITAFVMGMPLLYMQVSIGQYTQLSGTYLRNMCPIGTGIGYLFGISTVLSIIPIAAFAGNVLLYLLNMFKLELPWLFCEEEHKEFCWAAQICTNGPCVNETVQLSTHYYYLHNFMEMTTKGQKYLPDPRMLFGTLVVWCLIYLTLVYSTSSINKSIKSLFFVSIAFTVVVIIVLLIYTPEAIGGVLLTLNVTFQSFIEINAWKKCAQNVIMSMGLSKGGQILMGSYLDSYASSGLKALYSSINLNVICYLFLVLPHLSISSVMINCQISGDIPEQLYYEVAYNTIPFSLGYSGLAFLLTFMYFISCFLLSVAYVMLNTKIVQISIEDENPNLVKYSNYIRFMFLISCFLISLMFIIKGCYFLMHEHYMHLLNSFNLCVVFMFSLLVSWSYGVQRLCDDIHFNVGSQPSQYCKVCWYLMPGILGVCYFSDMMDFTNQDEKYNLLILHGLLLPTFVLTLLEISRYFKLRNLLGLFQPRERWGPPNLNERMLRRLFNPRMEIHSRRRHDNCPHPCLLDSKAMRFIIKEERLYHINLGSIGSD